MIVSSRAEKLLDISKHRVHMGYNNACKIPTTSHLKKATTSDHLRQTLLKVCAFE